MRAPSSRPRRAVPSVYRTRIRALLQAAWAPVWGVDRATLFRGATDVRFVPLSRDDKVRWDGGVLLVDDTYATGLARGGRPIREQLALIALYVVHELFHVHQGIGDKRVVGRLRATGHEDTLMHLDLEADHVACRVVAQAFPESDLLWLKAVQADSISAFPCTPKHSPASRLRKTMRAVSLRVDTFLRVERPWVDLGDGYAFVVFAPVAGPLQVFASGLATRLLADVGIDDQQADLLMGLLDRPAA